ncbi:MAG: signal peptidase I, partial [Anaerolineae bacterium]|nr:signal peptidase I [Phycisphaerae bacterium]
AFILAFIFRAFVVEAFVIPTGSMAPTLLGAHMRFRCPDCGYEFDTNFNVNSSGSSDDLDIPKTGGRHENIFCPNCGYHLPAAEPTDPAYNPFVRYGDRILVLKYLYLLKDPQRWDVVVFKSPDRPDVYDYTQNYIKRLIGKPGESIMILDGDIYAGPKGAPRDRLQVQTKPREVQESLWRVIHDSDYRPHGVPRINAPAYREPWTPRSGQSGWDFGPTNNVAAERVFKFDNLTGSGEIFFNDGANTQQTRSSTFSDWLAYDSEAGRGSKWNLVGDLKLKFFYDRKTGDGPLRLTLSKRGQNFVAEIGKTTARLLLADGNDQPQELIPATEFPSRSGPMSIEFSNADYQVTVRINDRDVLQTTPQQYAPDLAALLAGSGADAPAPEVRISAANQQAALSHISLWRDIYYLSDGPRVDVRRNGRLTPEDFRGTADNIMQLNDDEFFTLGDNSQISGDGRYWQEPTVLPYEGLNVDPGKVPARFMLGKAFFVYWPAGYRPFESSTVPAVVPNFGDMRFIH